MSELKEERDELAEDEEKLQIALQECDHEWLSEVEEDDEDDCLFIDLDEKPLTISDITGRSSSPTFTASGSQLIVLNEEESQDAPPDPELPLASAKETDGTDAEKTLALNRALQGILEEHMFDIHQALEENKRKQCMLEEGSWNEENGGRSDGKIIGPFKSPYYQSGVSVPPTNEDVRLKKQTGELSYDEIYRHQVVSLRMKENLIAGIAEDLREQSMKPLMSRLESEVKKSKDLHRAIDSAQVTLARKRVNLNLLSKTKLSQRSSHPQNNEVKELSAEVKRLEKEVAEKLKQEQDQTEIMEAVEEEIEQMKAKDQMPEGSKVNAESVDWMKISKMRFGDKTSWVDCQKAWEHVVDPAINKAPWTKEEEKHMQQLVKQHSTGRWELIAKELGTKRTPFMCFHHYQRSLNQEFKFRPWTEEEGKHLLAVTEKVRESSSFFSWRKVSGLVESRSSLECKCQHLKLDVNIRRGRWSWSEDARLFTAVQILGNSWIKISRLMGNRTAHQCRDRYTQSLDPTLNFGFNTYEEDAKLLKLRHEGWSWCKMVKQFNGRTDNMLSNRYKILQTWKKEVEWWEEQTEETKRMLLGKHLSVRDRKSHEGQWKNYFALRLGIFSEDYEKQKRDRDNGIDPALIPPRPPRHLKYTKFSRLRREKNLERWTNKLAFHSRLALNLKLLQARRQMKLPKGKEDHEREEKEVIAQLIESTAEETVNGFTPCSKAKYSSMLNALNQCFLGDASINVKQLLETCSGDKVVKRGPKKKVGVSVQVNSELKTFLQRNDRSCLKLGRQRKILPVYSRSSTRVKSELEEVNSSIPILMFDLLGAGFEGCYYDVKHRDMRNEQERLEMMNFKEDEEYKSKVQMLENRIAGMRNEPFMVPGKRDKEIANLEKAIKKLERLFRGFYSEKKKQVNYDQDEIKLDVQFMEALRQKEPELRSSIPFRNADPRHSPMVAVQIMSSPMISEALVSYNSENVTDVAPQNDTGRHRITRRSASVRKRECPLKEDSAPSKKFKYRSLEELCRDRDKIPVREGPSITALPYLPPNKYTLNALRTLALKREDLVTTAGVLYNVEDYRKKHSQHCVTTNNGGEVSDEMNIPPTSIPTRENDVREDIRSKVTDLSTRSQPSNEGRIEIGAHNRDFVVTNMTGNITGAVSTSLPREPVRGSSDISAPPLPLSVTISSGNQGSSRSKVKNYQRDNSTSRDQLRNKIVKVIPRQVQSSYKVTYGLCLPSVRHKYASGDHQTLPQPVKTSGNVKIVTMPKTEQHSITLQNFQTSAASQESLEKIEVGKDSHVEPQKVDEDELQLMADAPVKKILEDEAKTMQPLKQVVVVGINPKTKNVFHLKNSPGTNDFVRCKESTSQPESNIANPVLGADSQHPYDKSIIHSIRETDEYKTFAARLHSLFMWPLLMSTVKPPVISSVKEARKASWSKVKGKRKSPCQDRIEESESQTEERRKERTNANQVGDGKKDSTANEMEKSTEDMEVKNPVEEENRQERDTEKQAVIEREATKQTKYEKVEPKGGRHKNYRCPSIVTVDRPIRQTRLKKPAPVVPPTHHLPLYVPDWWKAAMLEAMLTKQAIERGEITNREVNLSEDEDFQDKGDYSDDDGWLASLQENGETGSKKGGKKGSKWKGKRRGRPRKVRAKVREEREASSAGVEDEEGGMTALGLEDDEGGRPFLWC